MKSRPYLALQASQLTEMANQAITERRRERIEAILGELKRRKGKAAVRAVIQIQQRAGIGEPATQGHSARSQRRANRPRAAATAPLHKLRLWDLKVRADAAIAAKDFDELRQILTLIAHKHGVMAKRLQVIIAVHLWGEGEVSGTALDNLKFNDGLG